MGRGRDIAADRQIREGVTISAETIAKAETSSRTSRRDAQRNPLPDEGSVRGIALRRLRPPAPADQPIGGVGWKHRWIVSGLIFPHPVPVHDVQHRLPDHPPRQESGQQAASRQRRGGLHPPMEPD